MPPPETVTRNEKLDLNGYFDRIGYHGPREPSLALLNAVTRAHTTSIPFENLDVLLGAPIDLAPAALLHKLVAQRRGGYCFEQNGLLLAVLGALGFRVAPLSARVRIDRPRDFLPPRTHMFVRVELGGETWLTDVGVGALSLTHALRLDTAEPQETPHEARRIVRENGRLFHQARLGDTWSDVCEFTMEEMPPIDREVANWFTSAHPASHFKNRLIVARAAESGRRITLLDTQLKDRSSDGHAEATTIATPEALLDVLADRFSLRFPAGTRFGPPGSPWPS